MIQPAMAAENRLPGGKAGVLSETAMSDSSALGWGPAGCLKQSVPPFHGPRLDGFRFYFYSHEPNEPPHIHVDKAGVDKAGASAKIWLENTAVARNIGFDARSLSRILAMVREHREMLLGAWNDGFGPGQ